MTTRSTRVGGDAERGPARYLAANGWPDAERRKTRGRFDPGDITGTPHLAWECKGGKAAAAMVSQPLALAKALAETELERRNVDADVGTLILQRPGCNPATMAGVARWWAVVPVGVIVGLHIGELTTAAYSTPPAFLELGHWVPILRLAGYGARR